MIGLHNGRYGRLWCNIPEKALCKRKFGSIGDLKVGEDTFFLAWCIKKASKIALPQESGVFFHQDESNTMRLFSGKLTEMTAWEKIVELYADEPLVAKLQKRDKLDLPELVVKYSKKMRGLA